MTSKNTQEDSPRVVLRPFAPYIVFWSFGCAVMLAMFGCVLLGAFALYISNSQRFGTTDAMIRSMILVLFLGGYLLLHIVSLVGRIMRRMEFNSKGIVLSLPGAHKHLRRRFISWDDIHNVIIADDCGQEFPCIINYGEGKRITPVGLCFGGIHLAMPILRSSIPEKIMRTEGGVLHKA